MRRELAEVFNEILVELDRINANKPRPKKPGRKYECGTCRQIYERINKAFDGEADGKRMAAELIWGYKKVLEYAHESGGAINPTLAEKAEHFIDALERASGQKEANDL